MRRGLVVGLVLVLPACLQVPPAPSADEVGDLSRGPAAVQRFLGDGTLLSPPVNPARPAAFLTGLVGRGGEPNIGATRDGSLFTNAWDLTGRSRDGGVSWTRVLDFAVPAPASQVGITSSGDPMLWVDPVTDRVYVSQLMLYCHTLLWSDDRGASWFRREAACSTPVMDHQKLVSGRPGPGPNPLAGLRHPTVLYTCYNKLATVACTMSYDGGITWPVETVPPESDAACATVNGRPTVSASGVVVLPRSFRCRGLDLAVSHDSGLRWQSRAGPRSVGAQSLDPVVAFDEEGVLYAAWQGSDFLVYVARSSDLGQTWQGPWRATPPDLGSTEFVTLGAGARGRIALSFLGSDGATGDPSRAPDSARWHLYVVTTEDGDAPTPTFVSYRATPGDDPVQIGCPNSFRREFGDPLRGACHNLGDFIDSVVAPDGSFYVSYTDGCTAGCAGRSEATPRDSRDTQTAVATLRGWSLR